MTKLSNPAQIKITKLMKCLFLHIIDRVNIIMGFVTNIRIDKLNYTRN
jgi:hypothetical protein